ncbi:hypothetical protein [Bacillus sp. FJAT-27245]|uniref:hypothetical protein n=1 Tax=Bacillus sp. FJAT-27245 TaxID=1684144 RepID=UPI0006A7B5BF|nr:hypothetical protein [Bacillus sp. FJAT-27245]
MMAAILLVAVSFTGGYLFIEWLEIGIPFYLHVFVLDLILSPVEFLAASIAFFSCTVANWRLLSPFMARRTRGRGKRKDTIPAFIGLVGLFLVFVLLFVLSPVHAVVLFGSSLVYGMISIYV